MTPYTPGNEWFAPKLSTSTSEGVAGHRFPKRGRDLFVHRLGFADELKLSLDYRCVPLSFRLANAVANMRCCTVATCSRAQGTGWRSDRSRAATGLWALGVRRSPTGRTWSLSVQAPIQHRAEAGPRRTRLRGRAGARPQVQPVAFSGRPVDQAGAGSVMSRCGGAVSDARPRPRHLPRRRPPQGG